MAVDEEHAEPASPPVSADTQLWVKNILATLGSTLGRTDEEADCYSAAEIITESMDSAPVRQEQAVPKRPETNLDFLEQALASSSGTMLREDCVLYFQHGPSFAWTSTVCRHVRHDQPLVQEVQSSSFHHRAYLPNCVALVWDEWLNGWKNLQRIDSFPGGQFPGGGW